MLLLEYIYIQILFKGEYINSFKHQLERVGMPGLKATAWLLACALFVIGSVFGNLLPLVINDQVEAAPALSFSDLGTHPQAAAQSTAAGKSLNTLSVFDGKVLAAYGDSGANTGPIVINPFDVTNSSFDGSALSVPTEQLDNWKVINNKLYTTTLDPTCSATCAAGYAVYAPGQGWQMKTPLSAEHIFDIETLTGRADY